MKNPLDELIEIGQNMGCYDREEDQIVRVLDRGFVRLVDSMGSDAAVVQAARVSYGHGTKKVSEDERLIRYLLRHRHTTPFEMVQFKFHVKAPIFVVRQWHRHRAWSYNEVSGRYSEMPDEFYVPDEDKVTKQNPNNKQGGTDEYVGRKMPNLQSFSWQQVFAEEQHLRYIQYKDKLDVEMRKELARINLPLSQYTEMYASVDLHNLFHFLKLRQDEHAQYEIRVYANAILDLIRPIVPVSVKAYEDYILGSINFSVVEISALKNILENGFHQNNLSSLFPNKREGNEFLQKLIRLGVVHD